MIMQKKIYLFVSILILVLSSCSKNGEKDNPNDTNIEVQTIIHDGITREYIVYVPESYDGTSNVPLVLNFHGFGGNANEYMAYADMRTIADIENFIVVYPQGSLLDGFSHWNAALLGADNKSNADDLGFISLLINELSTTYRIDSERIYACGYSNGAMFSYALACYRSDLIAAVGSVSGCMLDTSATCTPTHPVPMINIHGTQDNVIPYNGSQDYLSVETALNYWMDFNNTTETPIVNSVNHNNLVIEHQVYNGGNNDVSVEHYKITGGDHVWFDIDYQGANTGDLLWDFFSLYDIHGLR